MGERENGGLGMEGKDRLSYYLILLNYEYMFLLIKNKHTEVFKNWRSMTAFSAPN